MDNLNKLAQEALIVVFDLKSENASLRAENTLLREQAEFLKKLIEGKRSEC